MKTKPLLDAIGEKILIGDGCWEWIGAHSTNGYAKIAVAGRSLYAHRVLYEVLVGPIPKGLVIDHLCCNKGCVNPSHMEPVPQRVNAIRGGSGQHNAIKTHCPYGHPYDEANTLRRGPSVPGRNCRECVSSGARRRYRERQERLGLTVKERGPYQVTP